MNSIDPCLVKKGCCLKRYFVKEDMEPALGDVRACILYQTGDEGSKDFIESEDAVVEFELFLADLENKNLGELTLRHFLLFAAGVDRVPSYGLPKKIEIFFVDDEKLPRASTCGLFMQVPKKVTLERLAYTVREGIGYGLVWTIVSCTVMSLLKQFYEFLFFCHILIFIRFL